VRIVTEKRELRDALAASTGSVALVPTMGYLHEGHMTLFRRARAHNDLVVATIFVNPTQFGPNEDFTVYPRDPQGDSEKCRSSGVDLLWMPETTQVYAPDHTTTVRVDGLTAGLCGVFRPGHFEGVATVVAKLFGVVQPDRAYFGEKDFQQLAVIRRMARDLDLPVEVIGVPTIRDPDGLAMSSRNVYLSPGQRQVALALSRALRAARALHASGERSGSALEAELHRVLAAEPTIAVHYASVVDPDSLAPLAGTMLPDRAGARGVIAVHVGRTRLIDNAALDRDDPSFAGLTP
jgi:pantoate--beta-alanine ligase